MIESGTTFKNKGEEWQVIRFDNYENKFICCNVNTERTSKFNENEILEGRKGTDL